MKKRSITLKGHRTSVTLEAEFWDALEAIANTRKTSLQKIAEEIDATRGESNLASALRVYILSNRPLN